MGNLSFRKPSSSSYPCHTIAVTDEAQTTTKHSRFGLTRKCHRGLRRCRFSNERLLVETDHERYPLTLLLCLRRHYDTRQSSSFLSEEGKRPNKYTPNDLPWSVVQERVPGRPFAVARNGDRAVLSAIPFVLYRVWAHPGHARMSTSGFAVLDFSVVLYGLRHEEAQGTRGRVHEFSPSEILRAHWCWSAEPWRPSEMQYPNCASDFA